MIRHIIEYFSLEEDIDGGERRNGVSVAADFYASILNLAGIEIVRRRVAVQEGRAKLSSEANEIEALMAE